MTTQCVEDGSMLKFIVIQGCDSNLTAEDLINFARMHNAVRAIPCEDIISPEIFHVVYGGRRYFLCDDDVEAFLKDPDRFCQ